MSGEGTGDDARPSVGATAGTAHTVWKSAGTWLSNVGQKAKEAATAAGQQFDKAAVSMGQRVDKVSTQIGEAYDTRVARETAAANQAREQHRQAWEVSFSDERQAELLEHGSKLITESLTLAGDLHAELQYATEENPLGRESYGLMMLVNMMVPMLELGLRPDWKSVLPAANFISDGTRWVQNIASSVRHSSPSPFAMLQAAEQGWNAAPPVDLGIAAISFKDISSNEHKLQAWLFDSFNRGLIGQRLTLLLAQKSLLNDWLYPWAVLLQDSLFADLIAELVKIDSQATLIELPLSQLQDAATSRGDRAFMADWSEKMKESFMTVSSAAMRGGRAALAKASAYTQKAAEGARSPRADAYASSNAAAQAQPAPPGSPMGGVTSGAGAAQEVVLHVNDTFGQASEDAAAAPPAEAVSSTGGAISPTAGAVSPTAGAVGAPASLEEGTDVSPRTREASGNVTLDSDPAAPY